MALENTDFRGVVLAATPTIPVTTRGSASLYLTVSIVSTLYHQHLYISQYTLYQHCTNKAYHHLCTSQHTLYQQGLSVSLQLKVHIVPTRATSVSVPHNTHCTNKGYQHLCTSQHTLYQKGLSASLHLTAYIVLVTLPYC